MPIRERILDVKRDRAKRSLFNGGRRTFGYDIDGEGKDRRLVPNAREQAALARGRALRAKGKTFRDIADAWVSEFGMAKMDAKSIRRMLSRGLRHRRQRVPARRSLATASDVSAAPVTNENVIARPNIVM